MPNSRHNWLKFRCCSLARITNRTRCSRSSTMFHAILPALGGPRSLLPPSLRSGESVKDVVITTCKACHESEHLQARVRLRKDKPLEPLRSLKNDRSGSSVIVRGDHDASLKAGSTRSTPTLKLL